MLRYRTINQFAVYHMAVKKLQEISIKYIDLNLFPISILSLFIFSVYFYPKNTSVSVM